MKKEKQCESDGHKWCEPINESGMLYRTQYLVVSRTLMEAMPKEWQHRFADLMGEVHDHFDVLHDEWPDTRYSVICRGSDGRIIQDPWGLYRYPNQSLIKKLRKT